MNRLLPNIFLFSTFFAVSSAHAGDSEAGKSAYVKNCSGCHSTDPAINHYAPNLHCIINRKAGAADFSGYSQDFKEVTADLIWTEELLSEYLNNQKEFVAENFDRDLLKINYEYWNHTSPTARFWSLLCFSLGFLLLLFPSIQVFISVVRVVFTTD